MIAINLIRYFWRNDPGELLLVPMIPGSIFLMALWVEVLR